MQSTLRTESCCRHCGLTVHGGAAFCCRGCESVHALLVEKGLTNFYSLRDQYSFRKPVPAPELSTLTAEQDLWASSDSDAKARFYIKGIHCLGCLWILEKLPELEPRIKSSSLDLTHNILEVEIQPGTMPWKEVLLLIASLGYSAKPIVNSEISELRRTDLRAQLGRIGVAAFCAGNIMLLSVSIYGGADPFWGIRFGWLSFFLALPVLTYSAWPIYKAAFYPLLKGMISVDLAIASAIVSGAMMSFWSLISGSESQIYFDSLSMLIFLLLSSRYLLAKFRENLAKESACLLFLAKHAYQRILPSVSRVSADEIEPGDELIIDCGQTLPVDGTLMGASAHFDFSLLSGESSPIKFLAGDSIEAGAILKDGRCRIRALLPAKESRLAKILAQITSYQMRRSPTVEFADSLGKYSVIATLSMAAALVYFIPGEEGARRALALVIVTCPCVLAFAIPLAFTRAMQLAARRGILFIAPEKLEALASIKHIYFDKTGTLTNGNFEVLKWQQLSGSIEESQRAAKSLENGSAHPVGKAINRFCKTPTDPVSHRVEVPGFGVRGEIAGQEWAIGKSLYPSYGKNEVELFRRGILTAVISLGDSVRPEAKSVVSALKEKGISISMLSGDHAMNAGAIAAEVGIEDWLAGLLPEQKAEIISRVKCSAMVGDGANDALSFQAADVGIAVQGAVEVSLKNCDLVITKPGLAGLLEARELAERAMKVVRTNFGVTLTYNLLAGTLAACGFMQPLWAAIIMPLSALSVFTLTQWRMRVGQQ